MLTGFSIYGGEGVDLVDVVRSDTLYESLRFVTYMILDTLESILMDKRIYY